MMPKAETFEYVLRVEEGRSFLHRLDPRTKIIWFLTTLLIAILWNNLIGLFVYFVYVCALGVFAGVAKKQLTLLSPITPLLIFVVIVNVFFYPAEMMGTYEPTMIIKFPFSNPFHYLFPHIFPDTPMGIAVESIYMAFMRGMKLVVMAAAAALFFLITNYYELLEGIVALRLPYKLAFVVSIAFGYIPNILSDLTTISDAQRSRGHRLDQGGFLKKLRAYVPLLVPMIICAVKRASNLADAMSARAFGASKHRTSLIERKITKSDYKFLTLNFLIFAVAFCIIILEFLGMAPSSIVWRYV